MLVSLYTSRITLAVLGVTDYGIYNVVGGIVVLFTFLNGTMATATQRFLSFDIGKGNIESLKRTFSLTFWIHLLQGIAIVVLAEAVGLWLLYTKMDIPESRMNAAFWVFQFSVISTVLSVTQVPYTASIVAHEKMNIYAYLSIFDVVLKLVIVLLLLYVDVDKLVLYSCMIMCVTITMLLINRIYCIKEFEECHLIKTWDQDKFKELFSFAGWNLSAQLVYAARTQGVNIILNMFFGPALNAARGIAVTVNGTVTGFVGNFLTALNPQIVKYYAQGENEAMYSIIIRGCKYSCYLLLMLSFPLLFEMDFVLGIWLKTPPELSTIFCRLFLVSAILDSMSQPVFFGAMASGKIKTYQICMSSLFATIPLFTYIFYKLGMPSYSCLYPEIGAFAVAIYGRAYFTRKVTGFPIVRFLKEAILPCFTIILTALPIPVFVVLNMEAGGLRFILTSFVCELSLIIPIISLGMSKSERSFIFEFILNKIKRT